MGELVELDVTTVEESVTVNVTEEGAVQISVVAETGPAGPAGPNSVTSATTSDGTANLVVNQIDIETNVNFEGGGNLFFGDGLTYGYEGNAAANHRTALELDDMALLPNNGTATIDVLDATVQGTLTADHIHGNLAGSVYAHIRAGETLAKGDPVYVSGSHGSGANLIPVVSKADASNAAKMPAVGVMDAAVTSQSNGHMVITGTITELDTNAYPVNTVLYVATGGGWTSTPPAANSQAVAIVERSNNNNGAVIVKVNGLGSSGGNGAADANKLVRYNSTGGASITGGTLTDMTYAGTAGFTSTTRPTSAGTGTPDATSLITLADADARYGQVIYRTIDTTSSTVLNTYDTLFTQTLPVGRYRFEYHVFVKNNETSASISPRIRFTTTSGTISVDGVRQSLYNQGSYVASCLRNAASANHDGGNVTVGSPNFTEGSLKFFGYINVTAQAVMIFQFSHNTSAPTNPTTVEGHLVIENLTAS